MDQSFSELVKLVSELRGEGGCPWDREQTIQTLIKDLLEEAQEVKEAVEHNDAENLCEELGDLLWTIVLMTQVATEENLFSIDTVLAKVKKKIVHRHPHVFGDVVARTPEEARACFYNAKDQEKGCDTCGEKR